MSANSLASVGASETQVQSILSAARLLSVGQAPTLGAVMESYEEHTSQVQSLTEKAMAGQATHQDRLRLAEAIAAREADETLIAGFESQMAAAISAALNEQQAAWLANIAESRGSDLPVQYRVVAWANADTPIIRDNITLARRNGGQYEPAPECATALAVHAVCIERVAGQWYDMLGE